jgi:putative chitobiose transport system permease protein
MKKNETIRAYAFLFPALALLAVFTFYPIFFGTALSFFHYNVVTPPHFVGLKNFLQILQDPKAELALENSLIYLLVVPFLQLSSIILAVLVNQDLKGIHFFRACFYVPVITSIVVVALAWKWILAGNGLLNALFLSLHLISHKIQWLTNPHIALYSVMLVTFWKGVGYYMVLYLAGLQGIDPQYEEAAKMDGAGPVKIFTKITLPLLKPMIAFCTLISSIAALKVFAEVYVMTGGGPLFSTTTMVYEIYDQFMKRLNLGYASALGVILACAVGLLSFVNYKFFRRGGFEAD